MPDRAVVDASALIAITFDEPERAELVERLHDRELIAPTLLQYEVVNVALVKTRRDGNLEPLARQAQLAVATEVELYEIDSVEVLELALETGLSGYDAAYLWLAEELHAPLVTLDARLMSAATTRANDTS